MDRGDLILEAIRKLYDVILEPDAWKKSLPTVVSMVGGDSTLFLEQAFQYQARGAAWFVTTHLQSISEASRRSSLLSPSPN